MIEVRVIARAVAKPAREQELKVLLKGMLAPTHAERGCKIYEIYESNENGRFYFYELWENQECLTAHTRRRTFSICKRRSTH